MKERFDSSLAGATTVPSGESPVPVDVTPRLPRAVVGSAPAPAADYELEGTIGVGGMGQVLAARQVALDRPVAAKFLKDPRGDPAPLLREALVTGRLEHPNIIPVHVLATTELGAPFFTMKRVEGTPWSHAIEAGRPLVEHLETLVRVCDAVAFSHDRGVLHRDIKPDNVMLGRFGEVYLVDWGLAVSLRADDPVLPSARACDFAGTPAYMAPEMAAAGYRELDERCDVFLLGATLFHVLSGRPPNLASSPEECLALATAAAPPKFERSVPAELAAICRKAMAREPAARFPSVLEFKAAVTDWLRHREAWALYEHARDRLVQLEHAVGTGGNVMASVDGLQAHVVFADCRASFEQVRRLRPSFTPAHDGLQRALTLMVRYELARHEPRAARILLSQLTSPSSELVTAVEAEEQRQFRREARLFELERNARDQEADLALVEKRQFSIAFGVLTGLGGLLSQLLIDSGVFVPTTGLGIVVFGLPLVTSELFSLLLKRARQQNSAQRRMQNALRVSAWSSVGLWALATALGVELRTTLTLYLVLVAANWLVSMVLFQRRGGIVGGAVAVGAVLSTAAPRFAFAIAGLASAAGFFTLAWSLRRPNEPDVTPPS
ncbi:MAG: serine/threonine protein kinase [Myxococcaceae bacterium]|nr:serine/threonine protein kinase [Myxococcaceae bacterium]